MLGGDHCVSELLTQLDRSVIHLEWLLSQWIEIVMECWITESFGTAMVESISNNSLDMPVSTVAVFGQKTVFSEF